MERLNLYQKDTIGIKGGFFDKDDNPIDLSDKEVEIKIIRESNNTEILVLKDDDILVNANTIECEITGEETGKMFGNYLMQMTVFLNGVSIREVQQFMNVKKSY